MSAKYGYIGNNPSDTSVVVAKQVFAPTGVQTTFTFVSGYSIGYLDVYINGARQVEGQDYNATDTSTVGLSSAAQGGDIIELVAYKAFNVATADYPGDLRVQGKLTVVGLTTGSNAFYSGVVTATSFVGNGSGLTGAGSTVFIDNTTNQEFFPLFTATTSGTITASGISTSKLTYNPSTGSVTAVNFNSTSDINLKENIHTVGNALEITEQLRGVSFDWKETGRSSYGVIAQELEEVLPELVKQGEVKSVNYNGIIGVLIEAIKELKKEVEELKKNK